jgi:hypothetical protein
MWCAPLRAARATFVEGRLLVLALASAPCGGGSDVEGVALGE